MRAIPHEAVRFFCDSAEAVVFLTATPLQLGSDDLFVLLNLLRPDLIIDRESFQHMAAPNSYINRAIDAARGGAEGWQQEDCFDNALCESFFATLECELIDRSRFKTQAEARLAIFDFIEGWYNPHRRHSAINHKSPMNFERTALAASA